MYKAFMAIASFIGFIYGIIKPNGLRFILLQLFLFMLAMTDNNAVKFAYIIQFPMTLFVLTRSEK
jgi:hypothetical protein